METNTLLFSAVDGVSRWVHSGESGGNGCKMHNSMVTDGDVALLRKKKKKKETKKQSERKKNGRQEGEKELRNKERRKEE